MPAVLTLSFAAAMRSVSFMWPLLFDGVVIANDKRRYITTLSVTRRHDVPTYYRRTLATP